MTEGITQSKAPWLRRSLAVALLPFAALSVSACDDTEDDVVDEMPVEEQTSDEGGMQQDEGDMQEQEEGDMQEEED